MLICVFAGRTVTLLVLSCRGSFIVSVAESPIDLRSRLTPDVARLKLSHATRKLVFGVCDKVRIKPACSATEMSAIASRGIILSMQRGKKRR